MNVNIDVHVNLLFLRMLKHGNVLTSPDLGELRRSCDNYIDSEYEYIQARRVRV